MITLQRLSMISILIGFGGSFLFGCAISQSNGLRPAASEVIQQQATRSIPTQEATKNAPQQAFSATDQPLATTPLKNSTAHLNEPFSLKIGQSANLQGTPDDFGIFFYSVVADSRCPRKWFCAQIGEARVQVGIMRGVIPLPPLFELTTNPASDNNWLLFEGYKILLKSVDPYPEDKAASKEITESEYEATFVVSIASEEPVPSKQPTKPIVNILKKCAGLSKEDAEKILGEGVKNKPVEMILYKPSSASFHLAGICGYGSKAFTSSKLKQPDMPSVPEPVQSDHAVASALLKGNERMDYLLNMAFLLYSANPSENENLYNKLKIEYAAGIWDETYIKQLSEDAHGTDTTHIQGVDGMGDSTVWLWQKLTDGSYAVLMVQKKETVFMLTALSSNQRSEENVQTATLSVMRNMLSGKDSAR